MLQTLKRVDATGVTQVVVTHDLAPFVITKQTLAPRLSSEMQLLKTSIAVALAPVIQP